MKSRHSVHHDAPDQGKVPLITSQEDGENDCGESQKSGLGKEENILSGEVYNTFVPSCCHPILRHLGPRLGIIHLNGCCDTLHTRL